ncbi:ST6GALNAC2 [Branchiostoma lanceolatum]|uniref:alpha-N-acetylgalactosaminide alpha-2,6-sialyltransferase n=1 Tax=Branchiostoma lanceolatum TaxID=7740 RepID=A0A8K0A008_BRALA|nr:ST6GALNAC2 [Branchiostoma lanceolatum]
MLHGLLRRRWKSLLAGSLLLIGVLQIGSDVLRTGQDRNPLKDIKLELNFPIIGMIANRNADGHHPALDDSDATMDQVCITRTSTSRQLGPLFHLTNNSDDKFYFRRNPKWNMSTCSESLQTTASESEEFGPIFHPDIQMLINCNWLDVGEYWRMKKWEIPFGYNYYMENITYEEVRDVLKMFPVDDTISNFTGRSRPQCITCAVVGNGGMLNGSSMGVEIDKHDYVFRVNEAYTKGYEKDVGSRTTHYVFFDRSLRYVKPEDYPVSPNITYIYVPCRKDDFLYLKAIGERRGEFEVPPEHVRIIHPDFMRYIHFVWMRVKSFRPTTGAIMTMTALHTCDKLSLYGLGYNTKYSNHYFDRKYKKFRNVKLSHDHKREIRLWDSLDKEGIVYWYRRDVF